MFDHWQRFSLLEVLVSPLAGGLRMLLAPGSRTYWPYLLVSLAVAAVFWYREKQTSPHLPAALDVFSRATWTSKSALNDYALVTLNTLLFLYFLEALLPSATRWVPVIAAQLSIADGPLWNITPLTSSVLLAGALFLIDDFLRFIAHWIEHRVPFLWELHKVHHSATVLNFVTAERQHPVSLFLTSLLLISGAISVNANVSQRSMGLCIARKGNGRTAKVQGVLLRVQHHFDDVGIGEIGHRVNSVSRGSHAGAGTLLQQGGDLVDQRRVDQGLVALHIDHQVVTVQAQQGAGFGQTVAARRVVGAGQNGFDAILSAGLQNGRAVGYHHAALRLRQPCTLRRAYHHGYSAQQRQRLVGQAGGGHSGGNQDGKTHRFTNPALRR